MPFELHNKKKRAVQCCIRGKWGCYTVAGESFFPTIEEEESGLRAEMFSEFVPKLLSPTPAPVRRRLLEASGLEVPDSVLEATAHLAEFGGQDETKFPAAVEEVETSGSKGKEIPVVHQYTKIPADQEAPQRPDRAVNYDEVTPVDFPAPKPVTSDAATSKEIKEEMDRITSRFTEGDDITTLKPGRTVQAHEEFAEAITELTNKKSGGKKPKNRRRNRK